MGNNNQKVFNYRCEVSTCQDINCILNKGCVGIHVDCKYSKKVPSNMFGKVRNFHAASIFQKGSKRPKLSETYEVEVSTDKSVDKTDPGDQVFDAADRNLDHHQENNFRALPRLSLELMSACVSFEIVARLVNAALLDYEAITEEDTSQFVTISKLFRATKKTGTGLNSEAITKFRAKPPAFAGFDGKIMDVNSYNVDERGVNHPVTSKVDQIGKILHYCSTFLDISS